MKLFGLSFRFRKSGSVFSKFSQDSYILGSVLALAILFALFLGYDAYLFYQEVIDRSIGTPPTLLQTKFSEGELDEVIHLMDEWKKKFDDTLSGA